MNELSRAERFKKCLNCGSEEHRAKDCKAGKAEPKVPDHKPSVQAASTSSSQPVVQATPVLNMETFMQQAVQALRQLEAHPPRSDAAPHAQPPQPQPEGLSTASQHPSATGIVCTQSFGQEARYSLGRARELFPGFGSPKLEFPTPSSGSPNSGVGKCQKSGFGKL